MSGLPTRCAPASLDRGDQRYATAAPVRRWLLIEQPGPWGRDALLSSRLDADVAATLDGRCRTAGVRPMLIRRVGRTPAGAARRFCLADSRPGLERLDWGEYAQDAGLLGIDLAPPDPTAAPAAGPPTYLVCTHSRHDACCAIRGRPVARALAALRSGQVWECSHTGGDRFAANVVVLPYGLYYGTVTPDAAADLVLATESGLVLPDLLRGRSALPPAVQAAQHHARAATGDRRIDALLPQRVDQVDEATWRVHLSGPQRPLQVTVRSRSGAPLPRLTCAAGARTQRVTTYELVELRQG